MKQNSYKAIMHFSKPGSAQGKPWTVHYRNVCHIVAGIQCNVPMVSEWKPNSKSNPRAFFTAKVSSLVLTEENIAILS